MLSPASMRRRFLLRAGLTAAFAALTSASCLSPTLPLPPPEVETVTQSSDPVLWSVSGTCAPGALVIVFNDETGEGVVFEDRALSGQWFVQLEGEPCDSAWTSQERGNESSTRTVFLLDTITKDTPNGSGACD